MVRRVRVVLDGGGESGDADDTAVREHLQQ